VIGFFQGLPSIYYWVAGAVVLVAIFFYIWLMRNFQPKNVKLKTGPVETDFERKESKSQSKDTAPVRPITVEELRQRLQQGGQVNWIDRGATNVGNLRAHGLVVITGRMKSGKTREAVELIRRAVTEELINSGCIFEPSPKFPLVSTDKLQEMMGLDLKMPALLFLDDLPYFYTGEMLERLTELLRTMRACKELYVVATARVDQLSEEHESWLDAQKFTRIPLADFDAAQTGRLVDSGAGVYGLQVDDTARSAFIEGRDGRPELILMGLRRLHAEGVRQVTGEMAQQIVQVSLAEDWARAKRYIEGIHPCAEYLFDALAAYHAARISPDTYFVMQYANHLWKKKKKPKKIWRRLNDLRAALNYLTNFEMADQGGIIVYPDFVVEGVIKAEFEEDKLGEFLLQYRKIFQSGMLRRFYPHAETHAWELFSLGLKKHYKKEYPAADHFYSAAVGFLQHYGIYNNLGNLLDDQDRFEEAEAAYRQAIEKDPNYAAAYSNLGNLLDDQDRFEEAEAGYRQAIEKDPNDAAAYYNLGNLLGKQSRTEEAEAAYRQAIEKDPNDAFTFSQLGLILRTENRLDEAIPLFEKSQKLKPRLTPVLNLAGVYKKLDSHGSAEKYTSEARALIEPEDWYNLACLESICDNVDAAFGYLKQAALSDHFDAEWAWKDPDLEWIRDDPRFEEIVGPRAD